MTGLTNRKNWWTFRDDVMTDTDSGPFFHFPRHRGIAILRDLFLIQSSADFHDTRRNHRRRQGRLMNPHYFGSDPADIQIRINPEIRFRVRITFGWNFGLGRCLRYLCTVLLSMHLNLNLNLVAIKVMTVGHIQWLAQERAGLCCSYNNYGLLSIGNNRRKCRC